MDFFKNHPLEQITHNQNLSMLECLIPFIDYPFNLYLAVYIKISEIRLIISVFSSKELTNKYGLHKSDFTLENMISSFTGFSPDNIKLVMEMMKDQNMFSGDIMSAFQNNNMSMFSDFFQASSDTMKQQTTEAKPEVKTEPTHSFDDNFQKILAEYDMMQAAQLGEQSNPDLTAYNETSAK